MFCTKCGKKLDTDSLFCKYCGSKIEQADSKNETVNNDMLSDEDFKKFCSSINTKEDSHEIKSENTNTSEPIQSTQEESTEKIYKYDHLNDTPPEKDNKNSRYEPVKLWGIILGVSIPAFLLLLGIIISVIIALFTMLNSCKYDGCNRDRYSNSDYCITHKCSQTGCSSKKSYSSNYCYYHDALNDLYDYDYDDYKSGYVSSYELAISGITVSSNSSYTYAEGTIKNNSDYTVSFVEIKGAFKNSYGTVIDTDWTYAVGSEGLAPGESCKWRMSVDKDYNIKSCSVSIIDYDY